MEDLVASHKIQKKKLTSTFRDSSAKWTENAYLPETNNEKNVNNNFSNNTEFRSWTNAVPVWANTNTNSH